MAEAVVEDRPMPKFYCHMCNVQFQTASANYTCPHCSDGFIEELQEAAAVEPPPAEDVGDDDWEDDEMDGMFLPVPDRRGRTGTTRTGRRTLTRLATSNLRQNVPLDMLQDIIINWGVGNMLFMGNPGDYAWGREGLDAIVTQLLNQMDSTGPPPVSKETIDQLEVAEVTADQVAAKLNCSVCWEPFALAEAVRRLPCAHIYHEPCIRPWLQLHGTCPICRKNLEGDQAQPAPGEPMQEDPAGGQGGAHAEEAEAYTVLRTLFNSSAAGGGGASTSHDFAGSDEPHPRPHSDNSRM